jgi:hypothetical protein
VWRFLFETVWVRSPGETVVATSPQEAITSQQPESITYQQPEPVANQQLEPITHQQDPSADLLTAKTIYAAEIIAANKTWTEKEVSLDIS